MSIPAVFTFENLSVRTFGSAEHPLFVAIDVATALGFQKPSNAVSQHVDQEDITKQDIIDSMGRNQTVNCVNESGLYALIFGAKLESAKRFKRWVTSEVLPAIRKNGYYGADRPADAKLTPSEQYAVRAAVKSRALDNSIHYQTIYNALYDYFKIASYKDLRSDQLQSAITFINACELRPQLPPPPPHPDGALVLTKDEAMRIVNFVYYWRYLFRPELEMILRLLRVVDSPKASKFCDVVVSLQLPLLEKMLKQHGFEIPALN